MTKEVAIGYREHLAAWASRASSFTLITSSIAQRTLCNIVYVIYICPNPPDVYISPHANASQRGEWYVA